MLTLSASPDGVMEPEQAYKVDEETAAALVKIRAAEYADSIAEAAAVEEDTVTEPEDGAADALEQATAPELPEKAVKPAPKKKPARRKKKAK